MTARMHAMPAAPARKAAATSGGSIPPMASNGTPTPAKAERACRESFVNLCANFERTAPDDPVIALYRNADFRATFFKTPPIITVTESDFTSGLAAAFFVVSGCRLVVS